MGEGPNVAIMSHGATGTKEGFYPLMPLLAEVDGWRAIAYDAQGVGNSTGTAGQRSGRATSRRWWNDARGDGAKRIVLIGASQGAVVSLSRSPMSRLTVSWRCPATSIRREGSSPGGTRLSR